MCKHLFINNFFLVKKEKSPSCSLYDLSMTHAFRFPPAFSLGLLLSCVAASSAQAAGINHFQAAAGSHNYLVTNHPAVLPHLQPSTWLLGSYARNPLVCRDPQGAAAYPIVQHQANAEVAAAMGLFDRFEVGAVLPAMYLYGPPVPNNPTALCGGPGLQADGLQELSFADPRLLAKVLLTPWNEGFVASLRVSADMPLAQTNNRVVGFAGETLPNISPALTVGFSSKYIRFAADVGYLLRSPTQVGDLLIGHEILYGAATEVSVIPNTLALTLDVYGKASPAALFSSRDQFPLEGVGAVKLYFADMVLLGGIGSGLRADYGAPDFRAFAGIGYYPIPDGADDKDRDGILDADDACPEYPEDFDGYEDTDGCPDTDNDLDGILDIDDKCPDEPEDKDRWQDKDGCPDPDNDEDGILDADDECPNDPEVFNGVDDADGCPDSREDDEEQVKVVVRREKIEIREKVFFAFDSDRILPQSYELLDDVARVIKEHPEIAKILVEGHSDADGATRYNQELSQRRASSVVQYLIAAGVSDSRLEALGYGENRPAASNRSEEGKATNRRVEFTILDENDQPVEGQR